MVNTITETARVKYIYLDIVGFTRNRSVEAQSDLVAELNSVVRGALQKESIPMDKTVLIPTGDGMAIALIETGAYDVHLLLALEILRLINEYNAKTIDSMRKFEVRIGLNENVDNLVLDINEKQNVAGLGISMAQRIMDKADGGQILVGQAVYETLRPREKYLSSFKTFNATGKHGVTFHVYQYLSEDSLGLNVDTPSSFAQRKTEAPKFTEFVAHFVAHAYANRDHILLLKDVNAMSYKIIVLLYFLATDSIDEMNTLPHEEKPYFHTWRAGEATFSEQFVYYSDSDYWLVCDLSSFIDDNKLAQFSSYFERYRGYASAYWLPNQLALKKLCEEYPLVAAKFNISV